MILPLVQVVCSSNPSNMFLKQVKIPAIWSWQGKVTPKIRELAQGLPNAHFFGLTRFPGMPDAFYRDWVSVAKEEAKHFTLLRDHLVTLGYDYGSFRAHNALWDMAEKTRDDLLARIALVPRTLEARGLDASPMVKKKLVSVGDHAAGRILDVILAEEIGHVAVGNRWYKYLCVERGLDPIATYAELSDVYRAPHLRGPFNLDARRAAGFDEDELAALQAS